MEKAKSTNFENKNTKNRVQEAFENIQLNITDVFRPINAGEAKAEFLSDDTLDKPCNDYSGVYDFEEVKAFGMDIENAILVLEADTEISPIEKKIYESEIESRVKRYQFLRAGLDFYALSDPENKQKARAEFMRLNAELWGEPDEQTFNSLMSEKLTAISARSFDEHGEKLKTELFENLNVNYLENANENSRFKPSKETFDRFGRGVRHLFGAQLAKVPDAPRDGNEFSAQEIVEVFEDVVADFEEKTDFSHFDVVWKKSGAISVNSAKREISVAKNRAGVSKSKLEGLVAHEICTHYYRAQTGEAYGLTPLRKGMGAYLDAEEGIARAMETAVAGEYEEPGVPHYITAGLVQFEDANFRRAFEINWRLDALEKSKNGEISDEQIEKSRDIAYTRTQRIFRGTDELPWFKDLSYFNGGQKIWQYIEKNINNPMLFNNLLLGGKSDVLDKDHERILYELKTGK